MPPTSPRNKAVRLQWTKSGGGLRVRKSPKETVIGIIVEAKETLMTKEREITVSSRDPRLRRAEVTQSVTALEKKAGQSRRVEGETSGEEDDFRGAENDTVLLSFPNELVIGQYRNAEEVTVPVLIPPTSDDDLDDMMIVVDEDAEEAARIQEIDTQLKESVREAGLMEPPSTEILQTGRGKGRVSRGGETPTHQATPKPGSATAPEKDLAPGGASAPRSAHNLEGASTPESVSTLGGASAPRSAPTMRVASALRRMPTLRGTSVPESQVIHGGTSIPVNSPAHGDKAKPMSTPSQGGTPVPLSVAVLGGTSVPKNKEHQC